ncbi:MAG: hypothetical protein ACLQPD_18310 [Desulfomonilaceae bacterium]
MIPRELLDEIRGLYLDSYAEAVRDCRKDESAKVFLEGAFVTQDGELIREGPLGLPLRTDILVAEDGEVKESFRVDSEPRLYFDKFDFDWAEKLHVTLSPFQWDWCQAKIFGLSGGPDWKPLVDWFMSNFEELALSGADDEFSGVIHFMSDPEPQGDYYLVSLDLGSAPVETFETLLDAFILVGAKSVEIGQF